LAHGARSRSRRHKRSAEEHDRIISEVRPCPPRCRRRSSRG
jgi:hypothetical protein